MLALFILVRKTKKRKRVRDNISEESGWCPWVTESLLAEVAETLFCEEGSIAPGSAAGFWD
ncbi:hypothetical protein PR048_009097 [Dryococelus australis]|uniref:Uncharacterized protein n=1 Tax=Dryococelus australis TaxID=614101 RepID=A0ABQ9HZC1_9NEOP|nr:hypothetical protein PR048_009097 [Dryococelus australis]